MEQINTEKEFKEALIRCAIYMTRIGRANNVELDYRLKKKHLGE